MAQQGVVDQEKLCCSICLDLLKDPVTVPCGHSYCRRCIEGFWNQDDQRGRFSCPQCRHTFITRPDLKTNTMLADVVESLKKTGLQDVPPDHCYTGPGDVACDVCTGRRLKAVKTCLQCLVSYCDTHLQPHYQSPAFKRHKLVKASSELQENICSRHDEMRKPFCRTDQQCVCYLCSVDEHKGHDTISAAAERTERQKELDTSQQNLQQKIQKREKDVKVLHHEVESINHCADRAVEDSDTIFTEFIPSMERRRSELRELIRDQQEHEVSRAEELRRRVDQTVLSTPPETKTRAEFLQYSCPITLDPNTAHQDLSLSKGNRKVTLMNKPQSYPDHPERFTEYPQVLDREGLTGHCYWEVEWSGGVVFIAVSYRDISRTGSGDECGFGFNDKSWSLRCTNKGYSFRHRGIETNIPGCVSSRVGVYLDHSAGTLSFYRVSDTMTLLHTVHTTFTHNLHVGFNLYPLSSGTTAELCDLK